MNFIKFSNLDCVFADPVTLTTGTANNYYRQSILKPSFELPEGTVNNYLYSVTLRIPEAGAASYLIDGSILVGTGAMSATTGEATSVTYFQMHDYQFRYSESPMPCYTATVNLPTTYLFSRNSIGYFIYLSHNRNTARTVTSVYWQTLVSGDSASKHYSSAQSRTLVLPKYSHANNYTEAEGYVGYEVVFCDEDPRKREPKTWTGLWLPIAKSTNREQKAISAKAFSGLPSANFTNNGKAIKHVGKKRLRLYRGLARRAAFTAKPIKLSFYSIMHRDKKPINGNIFSPLPAAKITHGIIGNYRGKKRLQLIRGRKRADEFDKAAFILLPYGKTIRNQAPIRTNVFTPLSVERITHGNVDKYIGKKRLKLIRGKKRENEYNKTAFALISSEKTIREQKPLKVSTFSLQVGEKIYVRNAKKGLYREQLCSGKVREVEVKITPHAFIY